MEKVVVRSGHRANSVIAYQSLMEKYGFHDIHVLRTKFDESTILQKLYCDNMEYEMLISDYNTFLRQDESRNFEWGYVVSPEFVVCIGNHISFCHLDKGPQIFPWKYVDRGVYLADKWWFSNDEILHDVTSLSTTDFLKKYW